MRALLAILVVLCLPPVAEAAPVRILDVRPAGPVVAGQPVDLVVETDVPVDAARVTFPDLQGAFGATLCALRGPGSTRTVLPYRPQWEGLHSLQVSVTAGACGVRSRTAWRVVEIQAAPAEAPAAPARQLCPAAEDPPIPRTMRAARQAVLCLVNAERERRGLVALVAHEPLRRIASRSAHRPLRRPRRGEQRTVAPGESSPAAIVAAWMANEGHRRDLLSRRVRRIGVAVVPRYPEPLRRPETTYVVGLG